jgi:hypothetical protein
MFFWVAQSLCIHLVACLTLELQVLLILLAWLSHDFCCEHLISFEVVQHERVCYRRQQFKVENPILVLQQEFLLT